jgi:hypothetical protein
MECEDRARRSSHVNIKLELWFRKKSGKFLTSWITINVSKTFLPWRRLLLKVMTDCIECVIAIAFLASSYGLCQPEWVRHMPLLHYAWGYWHGSFTRLSFIYKVTWSCFRITSMKPLKIQREIVVVINIILGHSVLMSLWRIILHYTVVIWGNFEITISLTIFNKNLKNLNML